MTDKLEVQAALNPMFRWRWPWPEPGDPGPPWELIINRLDRVSLTKLIEVQLEVAKASIEAQQSVLSANLKALDQVQGVLKGMK
jgi:hypothetical protein